MADSLDALRYMSYVRSRWRLIAASSGIAVGLALVGCLLLPRQYTATARLLIEPPAGTDLRAAMAVSPIYLESLKTYEHLAASDNLFLKAVDRFGLRARSGTGSIESLKKRVLKVGIVRNTRILEIAATMNDPRKAQALARFLAESAVDLNRSLVGDSNQDLAQGIERQEREARKQLDDIDAAWAQLLSREPMNELQAEMEHAAELRTGLQQQELGAELEIADNAAREKHANAPEASEIRKQTDDARARVDEIRRQLQTLDRQAAEREKLLAMRLAHRDKLEADRKAAQSALAAVEARLREARGDAGYRGERLRVIDPGIVPERPSFPNLPLSLMAALLLGVILPLLYLTLELSFSRRGEAQRASAGRRLLHTLAKARDE